jgi:hypothetical protein
MALGQSFRREGRDAETFWHRLRLHASTGSARNDGRPIPFLTLVQRVRKIIYDFEGTRTKPGQGACDAQVTASFPVEIAAVHVQTKAPMSRALGQSRVSVDIVPWRAAARNAVPRHGQCTKAGANVGEW